MISFLLDLGMGKGESVCIFGRWKQGMLRVGLGQTGSYPDILPIPTRYQPYRRMWIISGWYRVGIGESPGQPQANPEHAPAFPEGENKME